jgi:hypothetical protein
MKARAFSIIMLALLLASILIGMQSNTAQAWEYDLGRPPTATQ